MKKIALAVLVLMVLSSCANVSEAACGLFGWRPLKNIAARRAEGRGIGQRNGPAKRLARGTR